MQSLVPWNKGSLHKSRPENYMTNFCSRGLDAERCYEALRARDCRFDGRFYTAVVSTGIFCRPTCPARTPKFSNCKFYRSAAAAHAAGFRPCLRCRPEVAPGLAGWRGTANTVRRALDLISEGGLSAGNVDALAARVGVGSRHLRRLFEEHVGASPLDVAQAQRLLFAKKLLSETHLKVSDVAFAAGFGSVRRFNAAIRSAYGRTPRELRSAPAARDHRIELKLPYAPPYDWAAMLHYLQARAIEGVEQVDGAIYRRSVDVGIVEVRPGSDGYLLATIELTDVAGVASVVARLRRLLDLDCDVRIVGDHLSRDPRLASSVAARPGLRVPGAWDGFETAVRAILGQQITVSAARQLAGKMAERFGAPLPRSFSRLRRRFPRPEALAGADIESLAMPRARARAVSALAAEVVANPDLLSPVGDLEDNLRRLERLPGIGKWTAQYIAMRVFREPDAFPASDVGLLRSMETTRSGVTVRPSPEELSEMAEAWRPWRAYAAQHLWMKGVDA